MSKITGSMATRIHYGKDEYCRPANSVSSPSAEAAANGWKLSVKIWRSQRSPTVWTWASVWSFRLLIFSHLTDELYESKIVYRTEKFEDNVRTFCMNPNGIVVNENTNGIVTVNGHSYEDPAKQTENTNFALLVSKHFSEPFKDSNGYGESIARLSNMLGGGVIVQRFGDLIRGRRSTVSRIEERSGNARLCPQLLAI